VTSDGEDNDTDTGSTSSKNDTSKKTSQTSSSAPSSQKAQADSLLPEDWNRQKFR
jgi:hypothetical protein